MTTQITDIDTAGVSTVSISAKWDQRLLVTDTWTDKNGTPQSGNWNGATVNLYLRLADGTLALLYTLSSNTLKTVNLREYPDRPPLEIVTETVGSPSNLLGLYF